MFSCLQILEAFLWFVLITLLNVTLIILTLSVSRLLNLLLRLVDRKSGSAGMPRPISYAVFCLKKKKSYWYFYLTKNNARRNLDTTEIIHYAGIDCCVGHGVE